MKLYNTLTKKVETITPQQAPHVTVYTCGPTVYDYPHIGNWFTFIRYDLLVRTLKASGLEPAWAMNITDVGHLISDADEGEDKLEKGARREHKTAWEVAQFYTDNFITGLHKLNITQPTYLPRATEHITEQVDLIKRLEEKGYTYTIGDGVYYDTSKFEGYAAFAQLDLDDLQAGARVAFNEEKRSASDFALWKFSPQDVKRDMEWDSPWGKGFPGWHIECSAMSMKLLGETLDIHSGGIDHVPVHHTNEIAQSEAATGKRFANYWMHANHITAEGEKISKSLGNGIRLEDIEEQGISLDAFRLHVLESHYRSQSKFSWESLTAAENRLREYRAMAVLRWQAREASNAATTYSLNALPQQMLEIMQDDLNTPRLLALLSSTASQLLATQLCKTFLAEFETFLQTVDALLGTRLYDEPDISAEQKAMIIERDVARTQGDWETSDRLRDKLASQGLELRDLPDGAIWHRR